MGVLWRLLINLPRILLAIPLMIAMLIVAALDAFLGLFDRE
jgi:hypothetical protein